MTVDIDSSLASYWGGGDSRATRCGAHKHVHIHADALSQELPLILDTASKPIDVGICNPPFLIPKWKKNFHEILEETGFVHCFSSTSIIDAALLFLAQNLRLLSKNATLAIILPNSLVSGAKYEKFRKHLLVSYEVLKVIQLPRWAFHNTDALASIFIIRKATSSSGFVVIQSLGESRQLSDKLVIPLESGFGRLDYNFHAHKQCDDETANAETLGSANVLISRGSLSSSQARQFGRPVFHTSHISSVDCGKWIDLSGFSISGSHFSETKLVLGQPGDILLARVGRNLETKIIGVAAGSVILTDCIYRIRAPDVLRDRILSGLSGSYGRQWISARAHGVAARHLTKADLLSFPILGS